MNSLTNKSLTHLLNICIFIRKSKLLDDDDDGMGGQGPSRLLIKPTIAWHAPILMPERSDFTPQPINSNEKVSQTARMASGTTVKYASEYIVPSNPSPLSDVEQALDMASQSSTVTQSIPFFVPQIPPPVQNAPAASPQIIEAAAPLYSNAQTLPVPALATAETVQSLGLPMFLVGQNLQALQTLSSTPSLLSTFVDSNGMYDHVRLMNLVQTLSQNSPATPHQPVSVAGFQQQGVSGFGSVPTGTYGPPSGGGGSYGPSSLSSGGFAGSASNWQTGSNKVGSYRGTQSTSEGNLHMSGYGTGITQSDIIAMFSPYVTVDDVVMKGTFCFVNTSDLLGAQRAREALNGTLLGGQPVRINMAQRKSRDVASNDDFGKQQGQLPGIGGSYYGHATNPGALDGGGFPPDAGAANPEFPHASMRGAPVHVPGQIPVALPPQIPGPMSNDYSNIRDDRGNPATKNLFVAGYGAGTTETQLRELFGLHCQIIGLVLKGTFCFINTTDKLSAIRVREQLSGSLLNGGVMRINFAKETGRLGTSFDLTYGQGTQSRSHYGRGGY
jgi:RNA recognition motif-containing protein